MTPPAATVHARWFVRATERDCRRRARAMCSNTVFSRRRPRHLAEQHVPTSADRCWRVLMGAEVLHPLCLVDLWDRYDHVTNDAIKDKDDTHCRPKCSPGQGYVANAVVTYPMIDEKCVICEINQYQDTVGKRCATAASNMGLPRAQSATLTCSLAVMCQTLGEGGLPVLPRRTGALLRSVGGNTCAAGRAPDALSAASPAPVAVRALGLSALRTVQRLPLGKVHRRRGQQIFKQVLQPAGIVGENIPAGLLVHLLSRGWFDVKCVRARASSGIGAHDPASIIAIGGFFKPHSLSCAQRYEHLCTADTGSLWCLIDVCARKRS